MGGGAGGGSIDTTPPTVVSTTPANGATGIARGTTLVTVRFSEAIDASSVTSTSVFLDGVSSTVTYDAPTQAANLTISSPLPNATTITGHATTALKDLAGNALTAEYVFSFSTQDTVPPAVVSTTPADTATGVALNAPVQITFDEALAPATVATANVSVQPGSASVSYDSANHRIVLTPTGQTYLTSYSVTVRTGVTDPSGNALATAYSFSYTTTADTAPPTVTSATPTDQTTGVPTNSIVTVRFSEAMNPASIDGTTVSVAGVTGRVTYDATNRLARFVPSGGAFAANTLVQVTVSGVTDLAGNVLAAPYTWSFTTGAAPSAISAGFMPEHRDVLTARGSAGTMVVWNAWTGLSSESFLEWALFPATGGAPISGEIGKGFTSNAQLVALGSKFLLGSSSAGWLFDGTSWSSVAATGSGKLFSGASAVLRLTVSGGNVSADTFDGTSWSTATTLGPGNTATTATADGGGFIVISTSPVGTTQSQVWVRRFNGTSWAVLETIEVVPSSSSEVPQVLKIAANASGQVAAYAFLNAGPTLRRATYAAGTWTPSWVSVNQLVSAALTTNGSTWALAWSETVGTASASIFDGTTWSGPSQVAATTANGSFALVSNGTDYLAVWGNLSTLSASRYTGTWAAPTTLATASSPSFINSVAAVATPTDYVVTWLAGPNAAGLAFTTRVLHGGTWSTPVTLAPGNGGLEIPVSFTAGSSAWTAFASGHTLSAAQLGANGTFPSASGVRFVPFGGAATAPAIAAAPSGIALLAWQQFSAGAWSVYGSSFDGTRWSTPFVLDTASDGSTVRVATNGSVWVVLDAQPAALSPLRATQWSPSGGVGQRSSPAGNVSWASYPQLASNGTDFMVAYSGTNITFALKDLFTRTSADGVTWSTPNQVEAHNSTYWGFNVNALAGGPAGYAMSYTQTNGPFSMVRSYRAGTWGARANFEQSCALAVSPVRFGGVCPRSDLKVFGFVDDTGTWTSALISGATPNTVAFALASSGNDFFALTGDTSFSSTGTTWSAAQTVTGLPSLFGQETLATDGTDFLVAATRPNGSIDDGVTLRSTGGIFGAADPFEASANTVVAVQAAYSATGGFLLAWQQADDTGTDAVYVLSNR